MQLRTLFAYLTGNREAILTLAADRRALWVGLLFVFSAAFAREYDGTDLLREPWHLIIPLGASLAASFLLFLVACGPLYLHRHGRPPFFAAYRSFLTLFWLTAPLAWLYAVPYERFLSPGDATRANIGTLAFVAAWRVALMVRVVSVLTRRSVGQSFFLVMAFADATALLAIYLMPKPVIDFMGGVRLTESEAAISSTTLLVSCVGMLSAPVWFLGGLISFFAGRPAWQVPTAPPEPQPSARGGAILAVLAVVVWVPILWFTQSEQKLRSRVESDMASGRIEPALNLLSAHSPADFPPQWDPPPRTEDRDAPTAMLDVMEVLVAGDYSPWVRACYLNKFQRTLGDRHAFRHDSLHGTALTRLVQILQRLPEGPDVANELIVGVKIQLQSSDLSPEDRVNLNALLKLAEQKGR